jgi:hypothetical protein
VVYSDAMNIVVKVKGFLDEHNISAYRLAQETAGQLAPNTVYALARPGVKRVDLATLGDIITALRTLTGKPVDIADLLEYQPPETAANHDRDQNAREGVAGTALENGPPANRGIEVGIEPLDPPITRSSHSIPHASIEPASQAPTGQPQNSIEATTKPLLDPSAAPSGLTAAGVPYTGDLETDAVLNDHPDVLQRVANLVAERAAGVDNSIPWQEVKAELAARRRAGL